MGYESRLYIVEKSNICPNYGKNGWGEVIAMFDMCKCYPLSDWIRDNCKETDCYILSDDGDTPIVEDCYGEPLLECDIETFYNFIETNKWDNNTLAYRRFAPMVSLIKSFYENRYKFRNLYVLHYGH